MYYFRGHRSEGTYILDENRSEYDVRGHISEEICF